MTTHSLMVNLSACQILRWLKPFLIYNNFFFFVNKYVFKFYIIFIFIFFQLYFYLIFILFKPKIVEKGGRKKATGSSLNWLNGIFISNLK